jgi:hypothetical protein
MKTKTYTDEAGKLKAKPRTGVEAKLYSGRTSHGSPDGLGKGEGIDNFPQNKNDQPLKRNSGDVANGWMRGHGGGDGISNDKPHFDQDKTRKGNAAPISKGGENSSRNPFSSASNAAKAESDWNPNYQPRNHKA